MMLSRSNVVARRCFSTSKSAAAKNVVLIDGARIPFALSSTIYNDYLGVDLQKFAFKVWGWISNESFAGEPE
jgi:hypothetical protein